MQKIIFALFICFYASPIFAQDTLPKLTVSNINNNILISWTNPFISLTVINIQRSPDSNKNFKTIGSVLNVKSKVNGFVDNRVKSDSNYYRIFLSFEGGTYLFTKAKRPVKDTSEVLGHLKNTQPEVVKKGFVPSKLVYTDRENNVIIALPNADIKKYSVKFFEEDGSDIFELNKITESYLILEKANFVHSGAFDFEVYEDGKLIEKHKVYINKEGRFSQ